MFLFRKAVVLVLVLLIFGFALKPFDDGLRRDMEEQGLLYEPLDLDTQEAIGQVSVAIALGGLRSLVATVLNLSTQADWEKQDWFELEKKYQTIVVLQPKTRYYWQTASFHLAKNAWADFSDKPGFSDAQRRLRQREFLAKGIDFLKRGVKSNPDDYRLWFDLAMLYEDPHRKPNDLSASAEAYEGALACDNPHRMIERRLFYVLARIPERQEEAYDLAKEFFNHPQHSQITSVHTQGWALQARFAIESEKKPLDEIFSSRLEALNDLSFYWHRRTEGFPMDGVLETIDELLTEFTDLNRFDSPMEALPFLTRYWSRHVLQKIPMTRVRPALLTLLDELKDPKTFPSRWEALIALSQTYGRINSVNARIRSGYKNIAPEEQIPLDQIRGTITTLLKEFQDPGAFPSRWEAMAKLSRLYLGIHSTNENAPPIEQIPLDEITPTIKLLMKEFQIPLELSPLRERGRFERPWPGFPDSLRPAPPSP